MVTIVFAVYAFAVIAGLLVFGAASDQLGRRRALLPGLALSAASAVAFLLVGGLAELFLGRVLSGLSAGLFTGTATATLVDLAAPEARRRATLVATAANIGGLGLGPLVCGLLAEYAPDPLRLVFFVDLCLIAIAAALIFLIPETVDVRPGARLRLQRLGVPVEVRAIFVRAALAAFAGFAILGLFTAVAPAFLAQILGETSHAVLGIVVAVAFESSLLGQLAVDRVGEERSLPLGCASMIAGMALLIGGLEAESLALIVLGGICAGIGQGLSFRAGLAAINRDVPSERRAETVSSYFVVAYAALAVPVIGVGIAADAWDLRGAGVAFAVIMAAIAAAVLISLRAGARPNPAG
jgi:MFS family permease